MPGVDEEAGVGDTAEAVVVGLFGDGLSAVVDDEIDDVGCDGAAATRAGAPAAG